MSGISKDILKIIMFTDGSCIKKPHQIPLSGYGVYFPNNELKNISKPFLVGEPTNQRAELYAIYKGIKHVTRSFNFESLHIYTDSEYSIKSLTIWIKSWKKNGWMNANKKEIANQDIIKKIDKYLQKYSKKIFFHHVKAHTGKQDFESLGNDKADQLAKNGAILG
jgi:ribonuclease HI